MLGIGWMELIVLAVIGLIAIVIVLVIVVRASSSAPPVGPVANCPVCHHAVSPWAAACPQCGHPFQQQR